MCLDLKPTKAEDEVGSNRSPTRTVVITPTKAEDEVGSYRSPTRTVVIKPTKAEDEVGSYKSSTRTAGPTPAMTSSLSKQAYSAALAGRISSAEMSTLQRGEHVHYTGCSLIYIGELVVFSAAAKIVFLFKFITVHHRPPSSPVPCILFLHSSPSLPHPFLSQLQIKSDQIHLYCSLVYKA